MVAATQATSVCLNTRNLNNKGLQQYPPRGLHRPTFGVVGRTTLNPMSTLATSFAETPRPWDSFVGLTAVAYTFLSFGCWVEAYLVYRTRRCFLSHPPGAGFQGRLLHNQEGANTERCVCGKLSRGDMFPAPDPFLAPVALLQLLWRYRSRKIGCRTRRLRKALGDTFSNAADPFVAPTIFRLWRYRAWEIASGVCVIHTAVYGMELLR